MKMARIGGIHIPNIQTSRKYTLNSMRFLCVDVKKSFRKIYKINVKL